MKIEKAEIKVLLEKSRILLQDPKHWCQKEHARTKYGKGIAPENSKATKWSLTGALHKYTTTSEKSLQILYKTHRLLCACVDDLYWFRAKMLATTLEFAYSAKFPEDKDYFLLIAFNDCEYTTHSEILSIFDKALEYIDNY